MSSITVKCLEVLLNGKFFFGPCRLKSELLTQFDCMSINVPVTKFSIEPKLLLKSARNRHYLCLHEPILGTLSSCIVTERLKFVESHLVVWPCIAIFLVNANFSSLLRKTWSWNLGQPLEINVTLHGDYDLFNVFFSKMLLHEEVVNEEETLKT